MKQLLVLFFILCSATVFAQDVIVKKDGSTILSKVIEVGNNEIKYKRYDNLSGPTYTINKSELLSINYQNGAKDTFSSSMGSDNRYLPNNQNAGERRMNDNALLKMDSDLNNPLKKLKTKRVCNWIGGIICIGIGSYFMGFGISDIIEDKAHDGRLWTLGVGAVGLTGGVLLIKNAINNTKKIKKLQSDPIVFYEFKFKNGTDLYTRIDFLRDQVLNTQTIGFGLQYNF